LKDHVAHEQQPTKGRHERTAYIENTERDKQGKSNNPERGNDESNSCCTMNAYLICSHCNSDPHRWPAQCHDQLRCEASSVCIVQLGGGLRDLAADRNRDLYFGISAETRNTLSGISTCSSSEWNSAKSTPTATSL
jgi:hypothetical protein